MERDPNLIISRASRHIVVDHIPFKLNIYKLEAGDVWSLKAVTADGTSIVWADLFGGDQAAFEEAAETIRKEGAVIFANCGSNVIPFKIRSCTRLGTHLSTQIKYEEALN
jgi:hypothetical protein